MSSVDAMAEIFTGGVDVLVQADAEIVLLEAAEGVSLVLSADVALLTGTPEVLPVDEALVVLLPGFAVDADPLRPFVKLDVALVKVFT